MDGLTLIIVSIVSAIIVAIFIYKKILPLIAELEKKEQKKLNELDIFINECNSKFYSELQALNYISKTSSTYLAHIVMEEHLFKKYYMPSKQTVARSNRAAITSNLNTLLGFFFPAIFTKFK